MPTTERTLAGAALITACRAVLAPGSTTYLPELGLSPTEVDHLPSVARKVIAHELDLMLVYTRVGASPQISRIASELSDGEQAQALDALLEAADLYVADHQEALQEHLWSSRVFTRFAALAPDEPSGLSSNSRRALLTAYSAYTARLGVVGEILMSTDWEVAAGSRQGNSDLDSLATMVGRRSFLRLARRISSLLSASELASFLRWASACAATNLALPATGSHRPSAEGTSP